MNPSSGNASLKRGLTLVPAAAIIIAIVIGTGVFVKARVIVENVFTTDMASFFDAAAYRSTIYPTQFPTGSWLEVKGLALPEFLIEIELEAHTSRA